MDDRARTESNLAPPNAWRSPLQGGALVVAIVAFFAGLAIVNIPQDSPHIPISGSNVRERYEWALPHLLIITLILTGFERIGDVAAIVVAFWILWMCGFDWLWLDPQIWALGFLQLSMFVLAVVHLRSARNDLRPRISSRHRLIGLGVSAAIALGWYLLLVV